MNAPKTAGVSVVLPNYNGRHLLEKNLPSLLEALDRVPHEILIVDDASQDDSVAFLQKHYPAIRVLVNTRNRGFSATCNKGIHAARLDLLCVVNTDVTFTRDYFRLAMAAFGDDRLFAVKGDIVNYRNGFDDVLNVDRTTRLYYKRGFLRFDTRDPHRQATLLDGRDGGFVGLGCCFLCDREKMLSLYGYDEIYSPFYWEDCDLAIRAQARGYTLLYLPEAKVFHQASSTLSHYRSDIRRKLVSNRNKFLFCWTHLDRKRFWVSHLPQLTLNLAARWLTLDWPYYAAFFMALTRWHKHQRPATILSGTD